MFQTKKNFIFITDVNVATTTNDLLYVFIIPYMVANGTLFVSNIQVRNGTLFVNNFFKQHNWVLAFVIAFTSLRC